MVDPETVIQRLGRLQPLLSVLDEIRERGETAFLDSFRLQLEAERALQVAIQICLDVGAHLISELGLRPPDDYRGVFSGLHQAGVLEADLAQRLGEAAGLRNLLVHGYTDIDPRRVWRALEEDLDDLRGFARAAAAGAEEER